jgi:hypothetical protein
MDVCLGLNGAAGIDGSRGVFIGKGLSVTRTLLARHHSKAEIIPTNKPNHAHIDEHIAFSSLKDHPTRGNGHVGKSRRRSLSLNWSPQFFWIEACSVSSGVERDSQQIG